MEWNIRLCLTPLVLPLILSLLSPVSSGPPEGPPRTLFRPRNRAPVHLKSNLNSNVIDSDAKKSGKTEPLTDSGPLSSILPPLEDATPKDGSGVRIFEVGTAPAIPNPQSSSTKSLLDDTEPMGFPTTPTEYEPENDSETENSAQEPVGTESFLNLRPTKATSNFFSRHRNTPRERPSKNSYGVSSFTPKPTVTLPGPPSPPVGPPTEVDVIGPSPSISSILPPSPPTGTGTRSLFGSRTLRRPGNKIQSARTRLVGREPESDIITDFIFSEIKCYRTKAKEYFGAKIHLKTGFHIPYVRDRPDDPLNSDECNLESTRDPNTFHMKMTDLRSCGVEQCGDSMCVTMVFPRVPALALADDEVTTIRCFPQKSSMAETKTISFAGDSLENRRSGSVVEGGGQDFAAEVGVFRQNRGSGNGLFAKRVNSGGVVQLGEPLQLRSVVRGGDGWTFSKLTDVKVWRMRDNYAPSSLASLNPGDASEVITLVDSRGCRNEKYNVIADSDPLRDPRNDLVYHFTFRAFLFRGQRTNEPLLVTAKVRACQERDDCDIVDCHDSRTVAEEENLRYKRSLLDDVPSPPHNNFTSVNWNSQLALRVVGLDHSSYTSEPNLERTEHPTIQPTSFACGEKMGVSAIVGAFITLLLTVLTITLISFCKRGKRIQSTVPTTKNFVQKKVQLKRSATTSARPDYVRGTESGSSNFRNKPLPPIPKVMGSGSGKSRPVPKLLQELATNDPAQYESIENEIEDNDDGVYVLYYKRSRSAPASLREKFKAGRGGGAATDVDSEEEWQNYGSTRAPRSTVRSVKKRSQRRQKMRDRKGIPSSYGDSSNKRPFHGSKTSIQIGPDDCDGSDVQTSDSAYSTTSTSSNSAHLVTRNDSSTQIIIIPETNV